MAESTDNREVYCPSDTTQAILQRHGISHELALETLVYALWHDHARREEALRERERDARKSGHAVLHVDEGQPPLICEVLQTLNDHIEEAGLFLQTNDNGEPVGDDGEADEGFNAMLALADVLEAAVKDNAGGK